MAVPADQTVQGGPGKALGELYLLIQEFNKLVVNFRVMAAKLDLDAGVTDVNYGTLTTDTAASGPSKILVTF